MSLTEDDLSVMAI